MAVAVSAMGESRTQRTLLPSTSPSESASNLDLSEWVYERIDTRPAPAEITPAPNRHAWLISPADRRTLGKSALDPTTGAGLLHPVTERHPFFSSHLSVAVGLRQLRAGQLTDKDHTAPARPRPVGCFGAPPAWRRAQNLDLHISTRVHLQRLQGAREHRVCYPVLVLRRNHRSQRALEDRCRGRLPCLSPGLGLCAARRAKTQSEHEAMGCDLSSTAHR